MDKIKRGLIILLLNTGIIFCKPEIEITEGLKSGTFEKKVEIINWLENSRNKVYLPVLGEIINNEENEEIRSRAALALLNIGDSTCIPYFKNALKDSYWQVRLYGTKGLVRYGTGDDIIPDLTKALNDSYWQVRYYAATGLGKYGDEKVLPELDWVNTVMKRSSQTF